MSLVNVADWLVVAEFAVALLGLIAFVVGYVGSSHGQWARSPEGRHLVNFRSSLAVFMIMAIINSLWHSYPGRDLVRVAIVGWFASAVVQGTWLLYRAQVSRRQAARTASRSSSASGS